MRRLYDEYSGIAHSADPRPLQLLGEIDKDGRSFTPLYPVFGPNSYAAITHVVLEVVQFCDWAIAFLRKEFPSYAAAADLRVLELLVAAYAKVFPGEPE